MPEYIKRNIMLYSLYAYFVAVSPAFILDISMIYMILLKEERSAHHYGDKSISSLIYPGRIVSVKIARSRDNPQLLTVIRSNEKPPISGSNCPIILIQDFHSENMINT
jgi:hypothetical protein